MESPLEPKYEEMQNGILQASKTAYWLGFIFGFIAGACTTFAIIAWNP